jgi:hypothetical protein
MALRYSWVDDAPLFAAAVAEDCGATAKVRMPTFDAITVAATPLDETGLAVDDAAGELDCAGEALLAWISICSWAWEWFAGSLSAIPSASAAKPVTTSTQTILGNRTRFPLLDFGQNFDA